MKSKACGERSKPAFASRSRSRLRPPTVSHVLTAVEIEWPKLLSIGSRTASLAIESRSILALLVYHYAHGMLASHEIESVFRTDPRLRLLCRAEFPDWRELRRFRCLNHNAVRNCLAHVLADENQSVAEQFDSSDEAEHRLSEATVLDNLFADE